MKERSPHPMNLWASQLFLRELPEVRTLAIVSVSMDSGVLGWGAVNWNEPGELGDWTP